MAEPYSPLRYPGGKARLAEFLADVIRRNGLHEPHYVEPYAGGAGAALRLLIEDRVAGITINDADPAVRCFWRAVTKHTNAFLGLLEDVPVTVEEWERQRAIYLACNTQKVLELGFATFFLNRTTRSGIIHNGGPIGGFEQDGPYKIGARFNRPQLATRILRVGMYADRIDVSGLDGLAVLKKIERDPGTAANTFVYLDPPYYVKGSELYLNRMTHEEHAALANFLGEPRHFPWIMTYDNVEKIQGLYAGFAQQSFNLSYSAYERRQGEELLIHPDTLVVPESVVDWLPIGA